MIGHSIYQTADMLITHDDMETGFANHSIGTRLLLGWRQTTGFLIWPRVLTVNWRGP
jgi:hypothetical protein